MTNQRSISWFFPLLIVLAVVDMEPAAAKPRDLSLYPLRVHIFQSEWKTTGGGQGAGIANLMDGPDIHGIDFSYGCAINYMQSVGNQAYAARWKKPGKTIEVVGSPVGNQDKTDTCDFKVTLHDYVYDVQNGTLSMFTQEQYKVRMGTALPTTGSVDTDINHYPLRISVLAVDWTPPLNGTRTASGRGNLVTQGGLSSIDFTTRCVFPFPANADGHYYPGQWTREGSAMVVLLRASGGSAGSLVCPLQTSVHTDIYVREASGAIKAMPPDEYRRSVLKLTAPVAPAVQDARKPNGDPSAAAAGNGSGGTAVQKVGSPEEVDAQTNINAEGSGLPKSDKSENTVVVTTPSSGSDANTNPHSAQAAALYRKACDGGSAGGCRNLALMYSAGNGVQQNYAQAAALYRKACNGGDTGSCSNLGLLYSNGTGVPQDYSQAVTLYGKACDAGDGIGCSNLGIMYAQGTGVAKDYSQAVSLYRKSCDAGSVISCGNLGGMYANGTGVAQDYGQAVTLLRKACDAGVVAYCGNLGVMYAEGTGVPKDYTQAVTLYRKACDAGAMASCGNLGSMYASGTGVPQDASQAVPLYRKACDAGLVGACVNLGNLYENGTGVSRDHAQAASLFRKACDGGAVVGCNNLGVMYEKESNPTGPPK